MCVLRRAAATRFLQTQKPTDQQISLAILVHAYISLVIWTVFISPKCSLTRIFHKTQFG
jgi:hypothetical protein